ncbi:MAG: hypothetical protein JNK73_13250 [Bacteroidia bacterium]|nr:hypothetical protein [Bacteroidia bacterium]
MARSITYWYDVMAAEKATMSNLNAYQPNIDDSQTLLTDLKSTSRVARWRLIFWCIAVCAYAIDVVIDLAILAMESIAARSRYGTLPWWAQVCKEYQHGDSLVLINSEWRYATENEAAQIVKLSSAREITGRVNLKIAKLVGDVPTPLSAPEEAAFITYVQKKKPAGIYVTVINDDPDELRLFLFVNYDPLVLDSTGQLISSPGTYPAKEAVEAYLKNLDFDGVFELMTLIDKVQAAVGVKTAYVNTASARYGANPFVAFTQRYYSNAGHMVIDPGTPLTSSITYTPSV